MLKDLFLSCFQCESAKACFCRERKWVSVAAIGEWLILSDHCCSTKPSHEVDLGGWMFQGVICSYVRFFHYESNTLLCLPYKAVLRDIAMLDSLVGWFTIIRQRFLADWYNGHRICAEATYFLFCHNEVCNLDFTSCAHFKDECNHWHRLWIFH